MNFNPYKVQLLRPIGSKIRTGKQEKTCMLRHLQTALSIMDRPFLKKPATDICYTWKINKKKINLDFYFKSALQRVFMRAY